MEGITIFIIKSLLVSGVMTAYYWFVLRNKKFHHYNRFYLLATIVLSMAVPVNELNWYVLEQPESASARQVMLLMEQPGRIALAETAFPWEWIVFYGMGMVSLLLLFGVLQGILRIVKIKQRARVTRMDDINFIETTHQDAPFSFFNNLFWQKGVSLDEENGKQIFRHELTHIEQHHTLDKLLVALLSSLFWMNPFFWVIRRELWVIHEFIADEKAIDEADASALAAMLLQTHYQGNFFNSSQSFFYSSIKRRLRMLTHSKKTSFSYLRRLFVLPISVALLLLLSFSIRKEHTDAVTVELPPQRPVPLEVQTAKDTIPKKYLTTDGKGIKGSYLVDMHGDAAVFMDPKTKQVLFAISVDQLLKKPKQEGIVLSKIWGDSNQVVHISKTTQVQQLSSLPSVVFIKGEQLDGPTSIAVESSSLKNMVDSLRGKSLGPKVTKVVVGSYFDTIHTKAFEIDGDNKTTVIVLNGNEPKKNREVTLAELRKTIAEQRAAGPSETGNNTVVVANSISSVKKDGEKQVVYLQGKSTTVTGDTKGMRIVADGKTITAEEMAAIDPSRIQSINVLKGDAAVKKYGEAASAGAIEITLKK